MKKLIIFFIVLSLFYSCESVEKYRQGYITEITGQDASRGKPAIITQTKHEYKIIVLKHPDLSFPSTEPDSVVIYEGFKPLNDKYFVVGKMGIIEDTVENYYRKTKEIREKAAEIGGHALIMVYTDTITKEYGGNIVSGISVPRWFWWDSYPFYMGTDYYWYKSPKMTVSTSYRIGLIIRWIDEKEIIKRFDNIESEMNRLKEIYIYADKREAWGFLGEQYVKERGLNIKPGERIPMIAMLEDKKIKLDIEKAIMISHYENLGEVLAKFKERYPLALVTEVSDLLSAKDNEGNPKYHEEEAIELSHQINYYRGEIGKLKKIYPLASGEEARKILAEKDENGNFKYSEQEQIEILSWWKVIDNEIAKIRKKCPLISEKDVWECLLEKDEEGNYKQSIARVLLFFDCIADLKKKEK